MAVFAAVLAVRATALAARTVLGTQPRTPGQAIQVVEAHTRRDVPSDTRDYVFIVNVTNSSAADPVPAVAVVRDGELVIRPAVPLNGVAPGQTAVVYVGTRVLGQCTIARTVSAIPVGAS